MSAATAEQALFKSGHEAIQFAYAYNPQQYPMSAMAKMMRGRILGSGRGLYGEDGAGVAGSVKRVIEALPKPYRYALVCRYCITDTEYEDAIPHLVRPVVAALGTGIHNKRFVAKLICKHYGRPEKVKLAEMADEYEMDASTVTRRWQRVRARMRELESLAMCAADDALVEVGLVAR